MWGSKRDKEHQAAEEKTGGRPAMPDAAAREQDGVDDGHHVGSRQPVRTGSAWNSPPAPRPRGQASVPHGGGRPGVENGSAYPEVPAEREPIGTPAFAGGDSPATAVANQGHADSAGPAEGHPPTAPAFGSAQNVRDRSAGASERPHGPAAAEPVEPAHSRSQEVHAEQALPWPPAANQADRDSDSPRSDDAPLWEAFLKRRPAETDQERPWSRHPNDRWIVGDEGRQPAVRARVPHSFRSPPPDTVIDGADIGSITYRAASVRGLSHQERGEPRQDAYVVRFTRDLHWLVGCIADGVSSAKRSHEAAAAVCDRITDILVNHLIQNPPSNPREWAQEVKALPWDRAVGAANGAVADLARPYLAKIAKRRGEPDRPEAPETPVPHAHARSIMSATALAFAVASEPSPDGTYRALLANVAGDSAAFLLERDLWMPLTQIKNEGEDIFSSTVKSLPDDAQVVPKPLHLRPGQALIMMTDGLGDPLGGATGSVSRFLSVNWRTPPDLLAFAQHLAFYRKTFTDDRTTVAIWPGPARRTR